MNKMNEDEAIKRLQEILDFKKNTIDKIEDPIEREIEENCYIEEMPFKAIETLLDLYKQEKEKYKRLSIEAQATAFMDCNKDTETLMRVLLKQGQIKLENGMYKRQDFDWEKNLMMLGLMKKREKTFYLPDEENINEYTKQLENQLQEYNKLKEIFSKRNITNETMYDGFCRLEEELEKKNKIIELMTKHLCDVIYSDDNASLLPFYNSDDNLEEKVKKYFERKAEDE
jgi:hypothetical protein